MSVKNARSHSTDPLQEHLRQSKDDWNAECRDFIAHLNALKPHLISFKRGLNGRGDAKSGLPMSNIKDPLPDSLMSYLSGVKSEFRNLYTEFNDLMDGVNEIVSEQANYSAKRRKPQAKANQQATFSSINDDYLTVEGSNPFTRFWARLTSIFSSEEGKHFRLSALNSCIKLYRKLKDFEDMLGDSNTSNYQEVYRNYLSVVTDIESIIFSVKLFEEEYALKLPVVSTQSETLENKTTPTSDAPISQNIAVDSPPVSIPLESMQPASSKSPSSIPASLPEGTYTVAPADPSGNFEVTEDTPLTKLKSNIDKMLAFGAKIDFGMKDASKFIATYSINLNEKNLNKKEIVNDRLRIMYNSIFSVFKEKLSLLAKEVPEPLTYSFVKSITANNSVEELEKLANPITKFLKKIKHETGSSDISTGPRLKLFNTSESMRDKINDLMDLLENKTPDIQKIKDKLNLIDAEVKTMEKPIHLLSYMYRSDLYDDKNQDIKSNPFRYDFMRLMKKKNRNSW